MFSAVLCVHVAVLALESGQPVLVSGHYYARLRLTPSALLLFPPGWDGAAWGACWGRTRGSRMKAIATIRR